MSILKQIEIKLNEATALPNISKSMMGDFVKKHNLDFDKLLKFLNEPRENSKTLELTNALTGKLGKKELKELIKKLR